MPVQETGRGLGKARRVVTLNPKTPSLEGQPLPERCTHKGRESWRAQSERYQASEGCSGEEASIQPRTGLQGRAEVGAWPRAAQRYSWGGAEPGGQRSASRTRTDTGHTQGTARRSNGGRCVRALGRGRQASLAATRPTEVRAAWLRA